MSAELKFILGTPRNLGENLNFFLRYVCPCYNDIARPDVEDGETVCRHVE